MSYMLLFFKHNDLTHKLYTLLQERIGAQIDSHVPNLDNLDPNLMMDSPLMSVPTPRPYHY